MDLHNDDKPIGRLLTRREILVMLGGTGAAAVVGTGFTMINFSQQDGTATPIASATEDLTMPTCIARPQLTEGPYFVDDQLNRSDIRVEPSDGSVKEGIPLYLTFKVFDVTDGACAFLEGAQVDVWHCDAQGVYSDVTDRSFNTVGQMWLRGYQITDAQGIAAFTTIYPGWYSGRTVHIHFKIRTDPQSDTGYEFTSQLFFPEAVTDVVHAQAPYASKGYRDTLNADDGIFQQSEGMLTLDVVEQDDGYAANFGIGLDLSDDSGSSNGGFNGAPPGGAPPSGGRPQGGQPPTNSSATATPAAT